VGRVDPIGHAKPGAILYEHMFVEYRPRLVFPGPGREPAEGYLALLAERTRPVSSSQTRLLPVLSPLAGLLPDGSLRRGTTIVVSGLTSAGGPDPSGGGISLAMSLLAAASGAGSWCALVGLPGLGAVAAHDMGLDLDRLPVVPHPGAAWAEVAAALIDGVDLVVLCPPFPPRPVMARRLVARTRERRTVLVVLPGRSGWPEHPDVHLSVSDMHWDGAGTGDGYLQRRRMTVIARGRRSATRPRHHHLWMPSTTGAVEAAGTGIDIDVAAPAVAGPMART